LRGLFVTGTDTGVGKTVLSAALAATMTAGGERVRAFKPVVTGLDDTDGSAAASAADHSGAAAAHAALAWPPDHVVLAAAAGMDPKDVAPLRFGAAVSPHLAAHLQDAPIDPRMLLEHARASAAAGTVLVVEGVGGLLVPLAEDYSVCDLAADLGLPLLIAARPGLGTINHTLLTLRAARAAGLEVLAVVLTPWPARPSAMELSNRETIALLGEVGVETLAEVAAPQPDALARAGESLPWRDWLAAAR
jgi:dethiobiotin synthetase